MVSYPFSPSLSFRFLPPYPLFLVFVSLLVFCNYNIFIRWDDLSEAQVCKRVFRQFSPPFKLAATSGSFVYSTVSFVLPIWPWTAPPDNRQIYFFLKRNYFIRNHPSSSFSFLDGCRRSLQSQYYLSSSFSSIRWSISRRLDAERFW